MDFLEVIDPGLTWLSDNPAAAIGAISAVIAWLAYRHNKKKLDEPLWRRGSVWSLGPLLDRHIGLAVLIATGIGLAMSSVFLVAFGLSCDPSEGWIPHCEFSEKETERFIWTAATGIAAAPGLTLTWFWRTWHKTIDIDHNRLTHEQNIALARLNQFNERFVKAVDLLGSGQRSVRLGAIYALEQLRNDSPTHDRTVIETLAAFVRNWHENPDTFNDSHSGESSSSLILDHSGTPYKRTVPAKQWDKPPEDVQSGLTVLCRSKCRPGMINLSGAHLQGANFHGAHLQDANFHRAHLQDTNFHGAHLQGAFLRSAHLQGAILYEAHLQGAILGGAYLQGAFLTDVHLEDANLRNAHLEGTDLIGARLVGADLTDADLRGADLTDADLEGADLSGAHLSGAHLERAKNLSRAQVDSAMGDSATMLPEGMVRPATWG